MVKKLIFLIICFSGCQVLSFTAISQENPEMHLREKVILFTDRNMYIAGESLRFSAIIRQETDSLAARILYCEVVTAEGRRITGGKFMILNSLATGTISLPDDILTGNYFMRAYTRYMRNYGPEGFAYSLIKVINPVREEVLSEQGNASSRQPVEELTPETKEGIEVGTNMKIYSHEDSIDVFISGSGLQRPLGYTISIVPYNSMIYSKIKADASENIKENDFIYPETRGITLTGKVLDKTGRPVGNIMVNLSILGGIHEFIAMKTDSSGRFYFSLPDYQGNIDVFLCTEKTADYTPEIRVDNDYCTLPVQLSAGPFQLSPDERKTALQMAVNHQIEAYFKPEIDSSKLHLTQDTISFYGRPDETVFLNKYVRLPTLEEYFNELPLHVRVRKKSGQKYFRIHSTQSDLGDYLPLVLVDMVAIDDPEKILAISPANIAKIEIVNSMYVKGDHVYGGIINFISQKGDFAGINLPGSGIFLNYEFLKPPEIYENTIKNEKMVPDSRNTILWLPEYHPEKDKILKIKSPETSGFYKVIVRGVDKKYSVVQGTTNFEVK